MLALGRLYADSEMTALFAGGFGLMPLIRALFVPGVLVMLLTGALNFFWAPEAMNRLAQVLAAAEQDLLTRLLQPGRFQSTESGDYAIYIESQQQDPAIAHGIFIAQQDLTNSTNVIVSQTGYPWFDEKTNSHYIVLEKGERYFGTPGQADYQIIQFEKYGVRLQQSEAEYRLRERMQSSQDLLSSDTPQARAEWQWRGALTVSVLVLALLAVLLAELKPRQGKYANALPAILVMIVYINILILAKGWVEDEKGISWLGMYWVVVLGAMIAIAWLLQRLRMIQWKRRSC
jgi:lipopolysaccharide export system permease protein